METFKILFTNSGKTVNLFRGTNALDAEFVIDYKFESKDEAIAFSENLVHTNPKKYNLI